jgi:adenylate kinase
MKIENRSTPDFGSMVVRVRKLSTSSPIAASNSARKEAFRLTQNVTLIGPPGSGKGYYGRLLSSAWQMAPLYSASRILRSSSHLLHDQLNSGTLIDCAVVSKTILAFLQEQNPNEDSNVSSHFLMDGFPRTQQQIQYMIEEWPPAYHITHAIHLKIPDHVCRAKMMGRRVCTICQGEPNCAHVEDTNEGFLLPPTRPPHCTQQCQPALHWQTRSDDVDENILQKRLKDYRRHEQTLLEYYSRSSNSSISSQARGGSDAFPLPYLCSITPYRGIIDFPEVQRSLEQWLQQQAR